jgi:catechol 2,3-dioxygenase-like lactoylglutathione lyase family enzyme
MSFDLTLSHVMLGVTDIERSTAFYEQTLGRRVLFRAGDGLVFVDGGPVAIGLNTGLAAARQPVAGAVELVFTVESVRAAHRELAAKGVSFVTGPRQATDKDWAATLTDPDGHYLTLFGPPGNEPVR